MNSFKIQELIKGLQELESHLSDSQGMDLKSRLDNIKNPMKGNPLSLKEEELMEDGKPKGIAIEKVSVLSKPKSFDDKVEEAISGQVDKSSEKLLPGEEEMTDEELEELLKRIK